MFKAKNIKGIDEGISWLLLQQFSSILGITEAAFHYRK